MSEIKSIFNDLSIISLSNKLILVINAFYILFEDRNMCQYTIMRFNLSRLGIFQYL